MSGKWACLFLQTNRFIKRRVTAVCPPSPGRQINGGRTLGPVGRRADGSSIQPPLRAPGLPGVHRLSSLATGCSRRKPQMGLVASFFKKL